MGSTEEVVSAARAAYNADPAPIQMQRILGAMILDMAAVYQQTAGIKADNPLADEWIDEFRNFQYRIYDYQQVVNAFVNPGEFPASAAAKHHYIPVTDLPKAYNLLVVNPILNGNAASTIAPDSRPYSKVGKIPDVATAVVLSKRLKSISEYADLSWTQRLIIGNLYEAKRAGEGIVSQAAADLGAIARMEVEKEMPALIEKAKASIQKHAFVGAKRATAAPIMLALSFGALALFGRKR